MDEFVYRIFALYGYDHLMCNPNVHTPQNNVLLQFRRTRSQFLFDIFHIYLTYSKTLMKTKCSKHIITFHTLNKHILLIKYTSDDVKTLGNNVRVREHEH